MPPNFKFLEITMNIDCMLTAEKVILSEKDGIEESGIFLYIHAYKIWIIFEREYLEKEYYEALIEHVFEFCFLNLVLTSEIFVRFH